MPDGEMTPGEIMRTFARVDAGQRATNDRVAELARETVSARQYETAHQALIDRVVHLEQDTTGRLSGLAATSSERYATVTRDMAELKERFDREIEDIRGEIKALRSERARSHEASWARWSAAIAAIAAVALVVVTLLGQAGGH